MSGHFKLVLTHASVSPPALISEIRDVAIQKLQRAGRRGLVRVAVLNKSTRLGMPVRERSHFILDIDAINKAIKYSHEVENMQEETKNNPYALIVCTDQ